jgi:translocation protein SEC62
MVAVMLAGVMFPLWPPIMRQGVSYLSMGVLGLIALFIGIAVVRLIFWGITSVILRKGIWWFPNLFEDVGFVSSIHGLADQASHTFPLQVDSFIPFWAWDEPAQPAGKSKSSKSSKEKRSSKNKASSAIGTTAQALAAEASAAVTGASTPLSGEDTDAASANAPKGLGDAPSTGATPSAADRAKASAMEVGGDANMRKRQMAYVEDAEE